MNFKPNLMFAITNPVSDIIAMEIPVVHIRGTANILLLITADITPDAMVITNNVFVINLIFFTAVV